MTTEAITPLRQRMIEDRNARKLGKHTQRGHASSSSRSVWASGSRRSLAAVAQYDRERRVQQGADPAQAGRALAARHLGLAHAARDRRVSL
jgi:hypothetical protein